MKEAATRTRRIRYGTEPTSFGELVVPVGSGPYPIALLVHGGFWRTPYDLTLMTGLASDLAARGYGAWNIEYRRVGDPGGGWPGTLADVACATDFLRTLAPDYGLDLARTVAIGHSAGGHLALWLAARPSLSPSALGPSKTLRDLTGPAALPLAGVISLAGVADLVDGYQRGLSRGAVAELLGGSPAQLPERYTATSPAALLPLGVSQALIHGTADDQVPVVQSRVYAAAARAAGDSVRFRELPGVDHFALIDAASDTWASVVEDRARLLRQS
ncbi:MAG: alpha/beta fold hydrolase [Thermomicrobiales bacterium]